jgi:predicted dithiol-disulfide oxidoreductase (DUF899 family)
VFQRGEIGSIGCDFNSDYSVGFNAKEQRVGLEYNYHREDPCKNSGSSEQNAYGTGVDLTTYLRERPGISAFVLENGAVHHTYSPYARGIDALWGMWQWLDRAPKGRNPKGPNETGHGGVATTNTTNRRRGESDVRKIGRLRAADRDRRGHERHETGEVAIRDR